MKTDGRFRCCYERKKNNLGCVPYIRGVFFWSKARSKRFSLILVHHFGGRTEHRRADGAQRCMCRWLPLDKKIRTRKPVFGCPTHTTIIVTTHPHHHTGDFLAELFRIRRCNERALKTIDLACFSGAGGDGVVVGHLCVQVFLS